MTHSKSKIENLFKPSITNLHLPMSCRSSDTVMSQSNVLLLVCISIDYNTTYDSDFQKKTGNNVILQEVGRSKFQPY